MEPRVAVDPVRDLTSERKIWMVNVKILRLWEEFTATGETCMRIIFSDREGCKIGAFIFPSFVRRFEDSLKENEWKFIIGFKVFRSLDKPRLTPHMFQIYFTDETIVSNIRSISDSAFISSPKFRDVYRLRVDTSALSDLVGYISSMGYLLPDYERLYHLWFDLINESGYIVSCVVTGDFARRIHDVWTDNREHGRICVLRFWKFEEFRGEGYSKLVMKSVSGCSVFIMNPDIKEALDFKTRFEILADTPEVLDP